MVLIEDQSEVFDKNAARKKGMETMARIEFLFIIDLVCTVIYFTLIFMESY